MAVTFIYSMVLVIAARCLSEKKHIAVSELVIDPLIIVCLRLQIIHVIALTTNMAQIARPTGLITYNRNPRKYETLTKFMDQYTLVQLCAKFGAFITI